MAAKEYLIELYLASRGRQHERIDVLTTSYQRKPPKRRALGFCIARGSPAFESRECRKESRTVATEVTALACKSRLEAYCSRNVAIFTCRPDDISAQSVHNFCANFPLSIIHFLGGRCHVPLRFFCDDARPPHEAHDMNIANKNAPSEPLAAPTGSDQQTATPHSAKG
jgi:hypothetical protein